MPNTSSSTACAAWSSCLWDVQFESRGGRSCVNVDVDCSVETLETEAQWGDVKHGKSRPLKPPLFAAPKISFDPSTQYHGLPPPRTGRPIHLYTAGYWGVACRNMNARKRYDRKPGRLAPLQDVLVRRLSYISQRKSFPITALSLLTCYRRTPEPLKYQ